MTPLMASLMASLTSFITGPIRCRPIIPHIDADPDPFDFVTISLRSEGGSRRFVNGSLVRPFPRRLWPTTAGWAADWADYISVLEMHDLRLYPTRLRAGPSPDEPIVPTTAPRPSHLNVSSRRAPRVVVGTLSGDAVAGGAVVGGAVTGIPRPKKPRHPRQGTRAYGNHAQHGAHPSTPAAARQPPAAAARRLAEGAHATSRLAEAAHATSRRRLAEGAHATSPSAHSLKHYRYLVATYPAARHQFDEVSSATLSRLYEQLDYWYACGLHCWHSWPLLACWPLPPLRITDCH